LVSGRRREGDGVDKGLKQGGFLAKTMIKRRDYGGTWNALLDRGDVVVGDTVEIVVDAE